MKLLRLASAVAMGAIIYFGIVLYERQVDWTVEQTAAVSAAAWLDYFTATVPEFEGLLDDGQASPEQLEELVTAKSVMNVFRFKLFNDNGELTFVSDMIDGVSTSGISLFEHNAEAAGVLRSGEVFVAIEDGRSEANRPDSYAEVYLPVLSSTGPSGVVEVYVDMADAVLVMQSAFERFALILAGLGVLALAIPTAHWAAAWRETRLKNAALTERASTEAQLAQEVRLIGDLNEWLQSSRSQAELFELVVGFLDRLLPACEGEIYVYANSRDVLDGCADWAECSAKDHIYPEDCWGLRRGRTYAYGQAEIEFPCAHVDPEDGRPYLCLPLLAHGETIGLLHLRQRDGAGIDRFMASRRLAQLCAEQISMAIANVRMRDELQDQSIRDSLTGLYNRRHLMETLRRSLAHAASKSRKVALLAIDVDHFKNFNDSYGHDAGDMVLRAVGEVLDRAVDGDEIACRPGGEEFAILLPGVTAERAAERAEKVLDDIRQISVRYGEKRLPSITASVGIALSPDDSSTPLDLLRAADDALYAAKAAGRNRIATSPGAGGAALPEAQSGQLAAAE